MRRDAVFRAAIGAEWSRALAHAGFLPGEARLWTCRGWDATPGAERTSACYWRPWLDIDDDHGFCTPDRKSVV